MRVKKEVTFEQRKDLRAALMSAFPSQPVLELMVEDELRTYLNNITQGQNNYELIIRDLVKWAEANDKVWDLILGASIKNPGNPQLQGFIQEHWQTLLDIGSDPSSCLFSSDILASLIQCLIAITDFEDVVLPVCRQTLPDLELDDSVQTGGLLNSKLSHSIRWLILLALLLKYGSNSENQPLIIIFVKNLRGVIRDSSKSALNGWLTELPTELQPIQTVAERFLGEARPSDAALKKLQVCFLIVVEPPGIIDQTDRFGVNGYLIIRIGSDEQYTEFQDINLQAISNTSSAQEIELEQQKKGLLCSFQQIEHNLPDWLLQAQEAIGTLRFKLQQKYSLDFLSDYDLTVEFWLPFEQLSAAADTWKIYGQPVRLKRRNLTIGKEYRVVVRSYDRFSDWEAITKLNRTWQHLETFFQKSLDVAVREKFEHIDCWERLVALRQQLMNQVFLGLTLTCPLCLEQYQDQRDNLFSLILDEGIPIALWSRGTNLTNLQEKMHELLTANTLSQLDQLLEQIKQTRKASDNEQHLGHHLAIWFDEPKHLIEMKRHLESRRLSA